MHKLFLFLFPALNMNVHNILCLVLRADECSQTIEVTPGQALSMYKYTSFN